MKIAAIILNYNSAKDTMKCLKFLCTQEFKMRNEELGMRIDVALVNSAIDLRLIVVDNNSSEDLQLTINSQQSTEFIYAEENRGYSAGNNIGLRRATEIGVKYALVINPDMELVDVNYMAKLVEVMERDEDIVVAATDIVTPEGIHQNPMLPDGDWRSSFGWIKEIFSRKQLTDTYSFIDNYKESHECAKVSGCCLLLRMSFVEQIGYFDEYPFLYCEEAILARQVEMAGKKMYYLVDVQAIHRHIKSEKGDPVKRFKHWQRSRIYFYKRYSKDSWLGRQISILSMRLYVLAFTVYKKIMKRKFGGNRHFAGKKFGGNRHFVGKKIGRNRQNV